MTAGASVTVIGLDELRVRMHKGSAILNAELRPAIRESAVLVRDEAKRRAPGNRLPSSVQFAVLSGGLRAIVGSIAATALSIHQGRRAGERVNFGLIVGWVRRTGLAGAVSIRTQRPVRLRKGSSGDRALRERAAQIVALIRARGTRPIPFIIPALAPTAPAVMNVIRAATIRAIRKVAR